MVKSLMKIQKRAILTISIGIVFSILLLGCGRKEEVVDEGEASGYIYTDQWKTKGFVIAKEEESKEAEGELNIFEYVPWEHDAAFAVDANTNIIFVDSGSCGGLVWQLNRVIEQGRHKEWVLELYDVFENKSTVKKFSYEQLGLENTIGTLLGMDMIDRENYVFHWIELEYNEEGYITGRTADCMIYTDLEGELASVDLWPAYLERGIVDENSTGMNLFEGNCDGKGNTYVLVTSSEKRGYGRLCFFDRSGNMILEYRGEQGETIQSPLRTQEGELIFPIWDIQNQQIEYLWADTENGRMCALGTEKTSSLSIHEIYGMYGNKIYYNRDNKEIVEWNIENGERVKLLDLPRNGLVMNIDISLAFEKEEYPVLYLRDRYYQKDWLAILTEQELEEGEDVRIAMLTGFNAYMENPVADSVSIAASKNRNLRFIYEDAITEEKRTRVLADLSSGNGPDIMYVSLEDMRMLAEKGALLDMRELLSSSEMERMLPGALELGSVNGKLVGLPVWLSADTLMISNDKWTKDTWTLEDIIRLMESGELEGAVYYNNGYFYPLATMRILFEYSLADSFLIDWENRKCHFDDERFIRLLELTYANRNETAVDTDTRLDGGKRIAFESLSMYNANRFDVNREREDGIYVGYPTEGNCGNYLTTEGVIVINAAAKNKEAVRVYLETFCDSHFQSTLTEVGIYGIDSTIGGIEPETGKWIWRNKEEVADFSDGTTAIDRANQFLRQCVAAPTRYTDLEEIIMEELNIMYEQKREPREVVKIINSRVQLYLDEGAEVKKR